MESTLMFQIFIKMESILAHLENIKWKFIHNFFLILSLGQVGVQGAEASRG